MALFEGFVPGRHPIEAFGAGGFRFAGMSHRGSILATPSGIRIWTPATMAAIDAESLAPVVEEAESLDFLIVGTGRDLAFLPPALKTMLREAGLAVETMATPAAARTWNVLVAEQRRVAAALIAVD